MKDSMAETQRSVCEHESFKANILPGGKGQKAKFPMRLLRPIETERGS